MDAPKKKRRPAGKTMNPTGKPLGKPPYVPDDETRRRVAEMTSFGIPRSSIAGILRIHEDTLRKYYKPELDSGSDIANEKIARNLYAQAMKDDFKAIPAAIFWCKTKMGFREKVDINLTGSLNINFDAMSDEELDAFISEREDS